MDIFIGIVEDDEGLRSSICDYIDYREGYHLMFAYSDLKSITNLSERAEEPDIILLDEHVADSSGIGSIQEIKKIFPASRIVIMTGDTEQELTIRAIENGAAGFLYKPFSLKQIDEVVNSVMQTGSYLHPLGATNLIKTIQSDKEIAKVSLEKLSSRETEIAQLLIVGKSYKEIAMLLNKSFHTVNFHIKNMYVKFDVNSKTELVYKLTKKNKRKQL